MASINFNNFRDVEKTAEGYTYTDLHLDIDIDNLKISRESPLKLGKDIKVDNDDLAIRNSLINIFNTKPGERFLVPEFGTDLSGYLFNPVSEATGELIGRVILNAIETWEPRVLVDSINVIGNPGGQFFSKNANPVPDSSGVREGSYEIYIKMYIRRLKKRFDLEYILTQEGFAEVQLS